MPIDLTLELTLSLTARQTATRAGLALRAQLLERGRYGRFTGALAA